MASKRLEGGWKAAIKAVGAVDIFLSYVRFFMYLCSPKNERKKCL
jgi:hypothetical protein